MTAHVVMYDIRYPRQEEALWLAQGPGDFRRNKLASGTSWFWELGRGFDVEIDSCNNVKWPMWCIQMHRIEERTC